MNERGNKYALAALRERRAEIAGEITALERRLRHLRESMFHVDGTLKLFDPGANPKAIPSKRPYKSAKLFGAGKLNRMILDALRKGGRPMKTLEVVDAVCADLEYGVEAVNGMKSRVRTCCIWRRCAGRSRKRESGRRRCGG